MTIKELIKYCDETRPNQYSNEHKIRWLNEVEAKVVDEIVNKIESLEYMMFEPYTYEANIDTELILPDQFDDVYIAYIYSKVDFTNAEFERYQTDSALFEAAWNDAAGWARRNYKPLRHNVFVAVPPNCGEYVGDNDKFTAACNRIKDSLTALSDYISQEG